jgi:hypothetical protein
MMKRNVLLTGAVAAVICLSVGCEWTGTSSEESWNDAYSWVNFSGTYRLYDIVVATPGTDPTETTTTTEINVENENQGSTGNTPGDTFGGVLNNTPIVAGSVRITIAGEPLIDNGAEVLTGGNGNGGTIKYGTGAWTAQLAGSPGANQSIRATYTYVRSGTVINPGKPGSSGATLTQITINQQGNLLTFTDNNGVVYSGRVTGANVPSDSRTAGNVRLNFEVSAGNGAKIIGTLSGDWSGGASGTLANRLLRGTYSRGGTHVELQGASGSISITPRPITTD